MQQQQQLARQQEAQRLLKQQQNLAAFQQQMNAGRGKSTFLLKVKRLLRFCLFFFNFKL